MANRVTILSIDDETGNALVLFEDDSNGITFRMGVSIPEEFADEAAVLDYVASQWPYEEFSQKGKQPANRHVEAKKIIGVAKNITGRVQARGPP